MAPLAQAQAWLRRATGVGLILLYSLFCVDVLPASQRSTPLARCMRLTGLACFQALLSAGRAHRAADVGRISPNASKRALRSFMR